ncbi:cobaltochelatase subunit CobN [Chryseobacterium sp. RLHN22]|uniref:cobaltochelatase subunit CobN n=1 Tax=Chryseobacterium sp. RLHN22 TaxID=3437885 RepID=UPI003D9B8697
MGSQLIKNKKKAIYFGLAIVLLFAGWFIWKSTASATRIALVNFQPYQASNIALSNQDKMIKFKEVSLDNIDKLKNYDFVLGFGMGLKIDDKQRAKLTKISKEVPMHFTSVTNPENNINSLDSLQLKKVSSYLESGNKENYQNLVRYIRKDIDGKKLFVTNPKDAIASKENVYFHIDEKVAFNDIKSYEDYLKKNNFYKEGAPKVALISGIHDPFSGNKQYLDSIIVSFQKSGLNVYPVASFTDRIRFLSEINPNAVVYFPHGRLTMGNPDEAVNWLKQRNIPFFTPLSILQLEEKWLEDAMGMVGGFMGQCIVMPELDGAIYPYVLIAQEKTKDGMFLFKTIPDRLAKFTQIVNNFIDLKNIKNQDKKVAVYYFKGEGKNTLNAQGMEGTESLYNVLKRLKAEGYNLNGLPETEKEFENIIQKQGSIFSPKAKGHFEEFVKNGKPTLIESSKYDSWLKSSLSKKSYDDVIKKYGSAPGDFMNINQNEKSYLAISAVRFGNIALLPQPSAAIGDDEFKITHGVKEPPTHAYLGAYLWAQKEFKADAMLHFGTHGSLEFTPDKQVALSGNDWGDILVGTIPHFYYYTIGNIGESMMAKRRTYATTISYLTPAFVESDMRNYFRSLQDKIRFYHKTDAKNKPEISIEVKKMAVKMGLHRSLRLDSILTKPYSEMEIEKLDNFAEEVSTEKINGEFYVAGQAYKSEKINSTVLAMSADPIAYSLASLDKMNGKVTDIQLKNKAFFNQKYLNPAKVLVNQILNGKQVSPEFVSSVAGVKMDELEKSKLLLNPPKMRPAFLDKKSGKGKPNLSKMKGQKPDFAKSGNQKYSGKPNAEKPSGKPSFADSKKPEIPKAMKDKARAILEIDRTLTNVLRYKENLLKSPEFELQTLLNALSGGYIAPSSGGDAVANPNAVPTGHNLYSVNAESTPSEIAWDRGVTLAQKTLDEYKKKHKEFPKKICYTFWSSEFVETEGVSIAQVLYMLGTEPVRDTYGRVSDVRLIPSKQLGRPRIDVIIQTSGQFRDLATSRLFLISKAIELAANAKDEGFENQVNKGTLDIEKQLVANGVPPKDAREMSKQRIFGGLQGRYDTGIKELITAGDKWTSQKEIADQYIYNMGATYGQEKDWGKYSEGMLRAALKNTDVIIQPRQNNTWGAISLDHVYEFMGGMNTAIKEVTGKDPDAYLADYRNRNNMRMQELKEAIGVEARATIFNPTYINEVMKGKASSASQITEIVTNTYGWNATRPEVIDNEMWNEIYDTYMNDVHNLGVKEFFTKENPATLQEMTAVMLETSRKGMWKANAEQLKGLASLHTKLVKEFGAEPGGFAGDNTKLQDYISKNSSPEDAKIYKEQIREMKEGVNDGKISKDGKVLKKEERQTADQQEKTELNGVFIGAVVVILFGILIFVLRKRRKNEQ